MDLTRRNFLTMTSSAIAGTALTGAASALAAPATETKKIAPDDETLWGMIRDQFTIAPPLVYLNNGTMGPSPGVVTSETIRRIQYTDSSGDYGGQEKEDLRAAAARIINCSPDEIALTHNATEGICVIAAGLDLKAGDEVILSTHEHAGNSVPWLARRQRDGIVIKTFVPGKSQPETLRQVEALITSRTKVIALPHLSCTIGQLFPVREIAQLARAKNIFYMVDGAHPVGMMPVDVKALDCDAYVTCGHKWLLGPKGTGFVYVRKSKLDDVRPVWCGGESDSGWNLQEQTLAWLPTASRYDFATQNNALYFGLVRAIDFMEHLGMENVGARTQYLTNYLRDGLKRFSSIDILTPDDSRSGLLGFFVRGIDYSEIAKHLAEKSHIRIRLVGEAGLKSVRISTHIYNTRDEVDLLLAGLRDLVQ